MKWLRFQTNTNMSKKLQAQIEKWKARPFSWSQISSWTYDKKQWHTKYILGINEPPNAAMLFGNVVGDTLGNDDSMVPGLKMPGIKEYKLTPKFQDFELIGFCDAWDPKTKHLTENKTSQNANRWHQYSVDIHGQMDMYALMLMLQDKVMPVDLRMTLHYIPVGRGKDLNLQVTDPEVFHSYETTRTNEQVLKFGSEIKAIRNAMEKYACKVA